MLGHEWEVILALAAALQTLTGGIIKYLLKQIDLRDSRIERLNEAAVKTNELNQQLAALYVTEQRIRSEGGKSPQ